MIRTFLAFDISDELRENLSRLVSKLQIDLSGIKWVSPKNIHCTLKFFGNVNENQIGEISNIVSNKVLNQKIITLNCIGLGVFPNSRRPRVVWVGLDGDVAGVKGLFSSLENSFEKIGFPKEERGFSPHLTLGRIKKPISSVQKLEQIIEQKKSENFGQIKVESLTLYKSVLTGEGSIYEVLKKFSFQGTNSSIS